MRDVFYATRHGRVHCREIGKGQPLLLMHSNGRSGHEFDELAENLAQRFCVISWDMPGHGDSDRAQTHLSVADLAVLAVEVATREGELPPIIGGSSIGATVAIEAGVAHPDAVGGIIAIELPLTRGRGWWEDHWFTVETMFGCPDEPPELVAKRYRSVSPSLASRLRIDRHKAGGWSMMQVLWAGREVADDVRARIASLSVPALFINGDHGLATDAGDVLPQLNAAARLAVIPDSGHFPQTDDPRVVARAVLAAF